MKTFMKATIDIDPESTAYIFENAFHYSWFQGCRVIDIDNEKVSDAIADVSPEMKKNHGIPALWVAHGGTIKVKALDPSDANENRFKWYTVTKADFERAYALYLGGIQGDPDSGPGAYPRELLDGSGDVNCCDAWLQYAVFGKLVYG